MNPSVSWPSPTCHGFIFISFSHIKSTEKDICETSNQMSGREEPPNGDQESGCMEKDQVSQTPTKEESSEDEENQGETEEEKPSGSLKKEFCEKCQKLIKFRKCFNCKKRFHRKCHGLTPQEWDLLKNSEMKEGLKDKADKKKEQTPDTKDKRGRKKKEDQDLTRWFCRECFDGSIPVELKNRTLKIYFNNVRSIFKKIASFS